MIRMRTIVMLLAVTVLLAAGCTNEQKDNSTMASSANEMTPTEQPKMAPPQALKEEPAAPPRTAPSAGRSATPGEAYLAVSLPASERGGTVLLEKSAPQQVKVGKDFDYRITVTNTTDATLMNAVLAAKLPADFAVVSSVPQAAITGRDAVWNIDMIKAKQSMTFVVTGHATRVGKLTGCSDLTFTIPSACIAIEAVEATLKLTKEGPAEVLICEPITYTITATNTGSGPATNVKLDDRLPEGLVYDGKHSAVIADIGTLAAGQSKKLTYTVTATKAGTFTNEAKVTADDGLSAQAAAKTIVRQPVLAVAISAPKVRYVGTPVNYEITVNNTGNGQARNTTLLFQLPATAKLKATSEGGKMGDGSITWALGTIEAGASKRVTIAMDATSQGMLESMASVTAICAKASAKATTEIKGIPAILLECVDLVDPVAIGEDETYVITVTNQGSSEGTNIVIKCVVPDGMEYVSSDGPAKATVEGKVVTFAPLPRLDPKAKAVYKVTTKGTKEGDLRFKVELTSDQMTSPASETESTHVYSQD